jgi:hypothetical protein
MANDELRQKIHLTEGLDVSACCREMTNSELREEIDFSNQRVDLYAKQKSITIMFSLLPSWFIIRAFVTVDGYYEAFVGFHYVTMWSLDSFCTIYFAMFAALLALYTYHNKLWLSEKSLLNIYTDELLRRLFELQNAQDDGT